MATTATASDLTLELRRMNAMNISRPDDSMYLLPDPAWVAEFAEYLRTDRHILWPALVNVATPQKGDCDEIAEIALAEANKAIMLSTTDVDAGGAVFAADIFIRMEARLFDVYPGPANHRLLLIRTSLEWIVFDPWTTNYETYQLLVDDGVIGALLDVEL